MGGCGLLYRGYQTPAAAEMYPNIQVDPNLRTQNRFGWT